jgi:hypothetical protein
MDEALGARVLGQIEEASLEDVSLYVGPPDVSELTDDVEILKSLRGRLAPQPLVRQTHVAPLDGLAGAHFRATQSRAIALCGRALPLVYEVVSRLVSKPHCYALLVLDIDARFDATCLETEPADLSHVYVQRPARSSAEYLRGLVSQAEGFMLYDEAARRSRGREWWGTVVVGGLAAGDLTAGWKGWARVDRAAVMSFALGMSAEEALEQRSARESAVGDGAWVVTSAFGGFEFGGRQS